MFTKTPIFLFKLFLIRNFKSSKYSLDFEYVEKYQLNNLLFDIASHELKKNNKFFEEEELYSLCSIFSSNIARIGIKRSLLVEKNIKIYDLLSINLEMQRFQLLEYPCLNEFGIINFETSLINNGHIFEVQTSRNILSYLFDRFGVNIYKPKMSILFNEKENNFFEGILEESFFYFDLFGSHFDVSINKIIEAKSISENPFFLTFINLFFLTRMELASLYLSIIVEENPMIRIGLVENFISQISNGSYSVYLNDCRSISKLKTKEDFIDIVHSGTFNFPDFINMD